MNVHTVCMLHVCTIYTVGMYVYVHALYLNTDQCSQVRTLPAHAVCVYERLQVVLHFRGKFACLWTFRRCTSPRLCSRNIMHTIYVCICTVCSDRNCSSRYLTN